MPKNALRPRDDDEADPQAGGGLAQEWGDFIGQPQGRAALMGFGAQLLQPSWNSPSGRFADALGTAGETAAKHRSSDRADMEAASKEQLRASQANVAEARAGAAGERGWHSAQMADIARQRLAETQQHNILGEYLGYQAGVAKRNKLADDHNLMEPDKKKHMPREELLPWDQWLPQYRPQVPGAGTPQAPGTPTPGRTAAPQPTAQPRPDHVQALRADPSPEVQAAFDQRYGPGMAKKYLGGQ